MAGVEPQINTRLELLVFYIQLQLIALT